jgi:hypothetical protein
VSQNQTAAALQSLNRNALANPEKAMKSRAAGALPGIVTAAALWVAGLGALTTVHAQSARSTDSASMVKPPPTRGSPEAPTAPNTGGSRVENPDNMPTKRPALPANSDRMLHNNPASDAIAK